MSGPPPSSAAPHRSRVGGLRPLPAVMLLAAGALLATAGACVVPAPISAEPDEVNLPPYYITAAVSPPFNRVVDFFPELDDVVELRTGPIGDPNAADRIFYRWFINYQPPISKQIYETGPPGGLSLTDLVDGSISNEIQPCFDLIGAGDTDLHRVEVVIADRPFESDDDSSPTPNQTVPEGAFKISIVWFIRFDPAQCSL